MSERKYDFNEYDREQFSRVLYDLKFKEWSINNFISYLQILSDKETNETKKEEYKNRIKSINKRKPREIKSRDIGFAANRTKSTVDKWIAYSGGVPKLPDIEVLPYLSRAFGVSTDCLLGLVPFPEIDKGDFPNLNKYGIDIDFFQKVYNLECDEQNDFFYVLKALDLLLAQNSSSSFSLLINIGKYLTSNEKREGVFLDNMNLYDLTMFIQNMIMDTPPENKMQFIEEALCEEGVTKLRYLSDITIDNIIAELKRYKVELKALDLDK